MKPLNYKERTAAVMKFLGMSVAVMSLFGFILYSQNIVGSSINNESAGDKTERTELDKFIDQADQLVASYKKAESQVERNTYSVELDKYILDSRSKFNNYKSIFENFESKYKDVMITNELMKKATASGDKDCDTKLEEKEEEIEELKLQIQDNKNEGMVANSDIGNIKTGIMQSVGDVELLISSIVEKGLCKTIGKGKNRKERILNELRRIKQGLSINAGKL